MAKRAAAKDASGMRLAAEDLRVVDVHLKAV